MNTAIKEYFTIVTSVFEETDDIEHAIVGIESGETIATVNYEQDADWICDLMNNAKQKQTRPVLASEMTLRDYFVGQMLAGALADYKYSSSASLYEDADILIKARDNK